MKLINLFWLVACVMAILSCNMGPKETNRKDESKEYEKGSFGHDLNFLRTKDSVVVLRSDDGQGQVIVSAKYQGKVFTSTADGLEGKSFGWINYKAFQDKLDPHMNGYGGENRLWLGPEGGKYSIFFAPRAKMEFENWHTPPPIDSEPWDLVSQSDKSVSMYKNMAIKNYIGTTLDIKVNREVIILEKKAIEAQLGISLGENIKSVGFKTTNSLTNSGDKEWTKETGTPCMWNLDMFAPSDKTVVVIPYVNQASGNVATTNYFGQIPPDRVTYSNGTLFFKADGKSRGKLGIPPQRAKPIAGSFDAENSILTITRFDVDNKGTYLNQEWTSDKNPLIGDAVNAYNDGPLPEGGQMGPFYEIESVSPAAFLKPGEKSTHHHSVFHFTGDQKALDVISKQLLGVSLDTIENTFKK